MRIRNTVLAKYFPELDKYFDTGRGEILSIVKWCPNPAKIAGMPFDRFLRIVTRQERGSAQKVRLMKIHELAGESIGCPMCFWGRAKLSIRFLKINVPKAGVFWPYITLFDPKMGFIRNVLHRQLIE